MSLGVQREARFWLIGFAVFFAALYLLSGILLPFVAGMAIAYLLDPVCDWLEGRGLSRTLATVLFCSATPTSAFIRSGRLNLIQRMPSSSGS